MGEDSVKRKNVGEETRFLTAALSPTTLGSDYGP